MIGFIFALTMRQQVLRKSTLLLIGLGLIAVIAATVFRLSDSTDDPSEWTAKALVGGLVVTVVLPLTALMFGTSVLGDELEDGTAVYLLTKPVPRWQILLPKIVAPWLLTSVLVSGAALISGFLAIQDGDSAVVIGAAVGLAAGALAYITLFVLLSLLTNHALIVGLLYVFIWEGALSAVFEGLRYVSIRHYTLGLANGIAGDLPDTFNAYMSGGSAIILLAIVTAVCILWANQRLQLIEIRERP
jgi:ABC-2 type transport system permease protein